MKFNKNFILFFVFLALMIIMSPYIVKAVSIPLSDIFLLAKDVSSESKINRPALILGILENESSFATNLGSNMGSRDGNIQRCVNFCDSTKCKKDGCDSCDNIPERPKRTSWCANHQDKLGLIVSEAKGLYKTEFEVPIAPDYGMGPAQFQPGTWRGYAGLKGKNPWYINDAMHAIGYFLSGHNVNSDEEDALKWYNSGKSYTKDIIKHAQKWEISFFGGATILYDCKDTTDYSCILQGLSDISKSCVPSGSVKQQKECIRENIVDGLKIKIQSIEQKKPKQSQLSPQSPTEAQKQTEAKLTQETPVITTPLNLGAIKTGNPYVFQLQVEGGKPPYVWSLYKESSPLPPDLSLSRDGRISGTPITAGTYNFVVQVEDGANWWKLGLGQGNVSIKIFSLAVELREEIVPTPTQSPEKKSEEKQVIPLPKEKEQTKEDKKQTEVKPIDEQRFEIITSALAPSTATVNMPYSSALLTATGGKPPYEWSLYKESSPLPPGLSINKNGVIEGTPTKANTYNFTVEAKDNSGGWLGGLFGAGQRTTKIFTLVVNEAAKQAPLVVSPAPTPAPPPTPQNNNFEMSMNNSITVMKGDTALQEISVTIPDGNKDDVNFTVKDNIPSSPYANITNPDYNFIPRSCKVSCKTILNINAISPEIPVGSFHVTVGTHSTNITSSFELKIVERTPPGAPTMRATAISASQIKLEWSDNAAKNDILVIERKVENDSDYTRVHGEPKRNLSLYVDPGLTPNTRYCYRIYFTNTYVSSPNYSQEQCATTLQDAPAIPQGKPDLTITSLRAPVAGNAGENASPQNVSITIANNGPVSAGRFVMGFYWSRDTIITLEDTKAASLMISGFGSGESRTIGKGGDVSSWGFEIPTPSSLSPGHYYLGAIIDYTKETDEYGTYKDIFVEGGQVQESNEKNNTRVADTGPIELKGPPAPPTPTSPPDGFSYTYTIYIYDYKEPDRGKQIFEWQKSNPNDVVDGKIFNGAQCEGSAINTIITDVPWNSGYIMKDMLLAGKTYSWNLVARANGVPSVPSVCRSFQVL